MGDSRTRWDWMKAVAERGPESPTTRHVLLTLGLHMNADGSDCWPSSTLLARETGLTDRCVREHLIRAEEEGWIERTKRGRVYEYAPLTPEGGSGVEDAQPRKEVPGSEGETPEGGSGMTTPEGGSGAERGSGVPRKEVPGQVGKQLGRGGNGVSNNLPNAESPGGEVGKTDPPPLPFQQEERAKAAIREHLHLGQDEVVVCGHRVGIGLELRHWRRLAWQGKERGEFTPEELTGAISVAREEAAADDPGGNGLGETPASVSLLASQRHFLTRCLHRFRKARDQ